MNQTSAVSFPNIDDLNLVDDLSVSVDQDDYVEQQEPLPLADGRYGYHIESWDFARDRKGTPNANGELPLRLQDGKYPIITIQRIRVVNPMEGAGRVAFLYHDVRTKPFARKDNTTGEEKMVTALGDLLRSADETVAFSGINEGIALLKSMTAQKAVFHSKTQWVAQDYKAIARERLLIEAAATSNGTPLDAPAVKAAINQLYKTYTREGMNKFKNEKGVPVPFMPSAVEGEDDVKVRVQIPMSGFIPARQVAAGQVKFGPTNSVR